MFAPARVLSLEELVSVKSGREDGSLQIADWRKLPEANLLASRLAADLCGLALLAAEGGPWAGTRGTGTFHLLTESTLTLSKYA